MGKHAKVVHGPGCWLDKTGIVIYESATEVVIQLAGTDDAGRDVYDVRMPLTCISFILDPATK